MSTGVVAGLVVAVLLAAVAVLFWVLAARMRTDRLPPNWFVGIRTPATLDSPAAWYAAHRATAGHIRAAAAVCTVAAVVELVLARTEAPAAAVAIVALAAAVLVLVAVVVAARAASRAAARR
jgi:uncharacterized membrane protein